MSNNYDEPPIIPAKTAIKSFRDSGYKSTAAAIAEIIDNAIEAKAKNIDIFVVGFIYITPLATPTNIIFSPT